MSLAPEEAGSLERGRFTYLPVVPGRLEFAAEVRRTILRNRPQVIGVEMPTALESACLRAVERLPEMSVLLYTDEKREDEAIYVVIEPADPFIEAIRTARECGIELVFIEPNLADRPHLPDHFPDSFAVRSLGLEKYVESYRLWPQARSEEIDAHAAGMAWKLQGADPLASVLVVVSLNLLDPLLDAMEEPQEPPAQRNRQRQPDLLNPHPDCLSEITVEYPYLQERYERYRVSLTDDTLIDRLRAQFDLLKEAEAMYAKTAGEKLAHWQRRLLARYTRNLAHVNGELIAGLFDLTVAARSIVDDNFGWEVWDLANRYPAQKVTPLPQTVNLSGQEIWVNTKKIRLRRRLPRPKQRSKVPGLKKRKKEQIPGEWAQQLHGNAICSYPPEDLVVEDYGRFLKSKARSLLTAERMRTEPFSTSMLDGIDLRETIRNWHEKKIYVREFQRMAGDVGSVVVIFDEDREDRYQYLTTWLGEHQNESDMAFYSTFPFDHMVGPGIGRAEYGGFLMTLPPRRMYDVWSDPDYEHAESKPERLLLAALDYSVERHVVYVAQRPPRSMFRTIAGRMGRSIIYIPIGQFNPAKLKKVRVVHVLDSYDRRKDAKDYIW